MKYDPNKHHRRSIRLKGYDYSQPGEYFITICTHNREFLFGEIVNGTMKLNNIGFIVEDEWKKTALIRDNVELGAFIIMPNHLHGIIIIRDDNRDKSSENCRDELHNGCGESNNRRGTSQRAPTMERFGKPTRNSIPTIIRGFKSASTKRINEIRQSPGIPVWQRNYYEHIIRTEKEFYAISEYIINNPAKWQQDREKKIKISGQNSEEIKEIIIKAEI